MPEAMRRAMLCGLLVLASRNAVPRKTFRPHLGTRHWRGILLGRPAVHDGVVLVSKEEGLYLVEAFVTEEVV